MKTVHELLAIADYLGDNMTDEQTIKLMDEARSLSIADSDLLFNKLTGGQFYTEMNMHAKWAGYHDTDS